MTSVYISHSKHDLVTAKRLQDALRADGFSAINASDIPPSKDPVLTTIEQTIEQSEVVVLLLSERSNESWFSRKEAAIVLPYTDKLIIPVLIDKKTDVPLILRPYVTVDMSDSDNIGTELTQLIRRLTSTFNSTETSLKENVRLDEVETQQKKLKNDREKYDIEKQELNKSIFFRIGLTATVTLTVFLITLLIASGEEPLSGYKTHFYTLIGFVLGTLVTALLSYVKTFLANRHSIKDARGKS